MAQQFDLSVEVAFGSGIEAQTTQGYGSTSRLPTFTRLNIGYQWENDSWVELGFGMAVSLENRSSLLLVPKVRLNRNLFKDFLLYGSLGAAADALPDARFGGEIELGSRYQLMDNLGAFFALGLDIFAAGPGVGHHGLDLVLSASLGLRTSF